MQKSFKGSIAADWQVEIIAESNTVAVNVGELATVALVYGYNKEAQVANAHLIAASKDLLEACIEAVEYLDNVDAIPINTISSTSILHNKMKAAISKALNTTSNE